MKRIILVLSAALACVAQPRILNAKLESRALSGSLDAELQKIRSEAASQPVWVGWAVPSARRESNSCCWSGDDGWGWRGCGLEPTRGERPASSEKPAPVSLEPPRDIHVLVRFEGGRPDKIRQYSADCELDAVDTRVVWLTGVKPGDSIAALSRYLDVESTRRALSIIALHADPAADALLDKYAQPSQPEEFRREAVSLIASHRGARGLEYVTRLSKEEANEKVRESAIRGLTGNSDPKAMEFVMNAARNDRSPRVRVALLGSIARRGGAAAKPLLQSIYATDTDPEVKKRAIEAFGELPADEGVPLLIEVAKSNAPADYRKRAMARLGRSRDPRAIAFVTQVLSN